MDYMNKKKYTIRTEVKKFGLYLHHYKRLNDTYLQSDGDDQLLGGFLRLVSVSSNGFPHM